MTTLLVEVHPNEDGIHCGMCPMSLRLTGE